MALRKLVFAAFFLAAPAMAQQAPTQPVPPPDPVTITGDEREEVFQSQMDAERIAGEARREFAGLRDGHGDKATGCRKAGDADIQYRQAIADARGLLKDAQEPLKARLEQRIEGMTERRDNLSDFADRVCRGDGRGNRAGPSHGGGRARPRGG